MSHTEGKLTLERDLGWNQHCIFDAQERFFASTETSNKTYEEEAANARRLVACWNACEGISTENLVSIVDLGDTLKTRIEDLKRQANERDELLAALRVSTNGLRHCSRWNISEETEKAIITQVIANELILDKYKEAE